MQQKILTFLKQGGWLWLVALIIYLGGWHTEVLGFAQRGLLKTGLFTPSLEETAKAAVALEELQVYNEDKVLLNGSQFGDEVVLINIWASWCAPCVAEMPELEALYQEMAPKGIRFLMITADDNFAKEIAFRDRKGYSFPIYQQQSLPAPLRSQSIPATYVMDKKGVLRYKHLGMAQYNTADFKAFLLALQKEP